MLKQRFYPVIDQHKRVGYICSLLNRHDNLFRNRQVGRYVSPRISKAGILLSTEVGRTPFRRVGLAKVDAEILRQFVWERLSIRTSTSRLEFCLHCCNSPTLRMHSFSHTVSRITFWCWEYRHL